MSSVAATVVAVLAVALAVAAHTGVLHVRVVSSSSMEPALSAGDVLLTRAMPAGEAQVGEVVTLQRPTGDLVTHRIVANAPDPDEPKGWLVTMRGDANAVADPRPFPATEVEATVARIPHAGGVLRALAQPPAMQIAMVSALALVIASLMSPRTRSKGHTP
ncbi:signal peptidase [Bogoriella caseilytica]|uniref:Signal peptidase I n=2 Tax=Bogoriella caseilytica TaxID=56055 RepID=A0A3N2BF44_9MICO|nr:signal peptidase [Bogoriella caseilytica]